MIMQMESDGSVLADTFTRAYVEAALWSSTDLDGSPLDGAFGPEDIAPETMARMVEDCRVFQEDQAADLQDPSQDGFDFWLTRNGHGAGFWDRGHGPRGDRLTDAAHAFGSFDLIPGDDGRIYT